MRLALLGHRHRQHLCPCVANKTRLSKAYRMRLRGDSYELQHSHDECRGAYGGPVVHAVSRAEYGHAAPSKAEGEPWTRSDGPARSWSPLQPNEQSSKHLDQQAQEVLKMWNFWNFGVWDFDVLGSGRLPRWSPVVPGCSRMILIKIYFSEFA